MSFPIALLVSGGGGTPKIGYYYCVNMVVVSVTAVLATIVIHIYVRGDRRQGLPPYIRRIFLQYLARLYCMAPKPPPSSVASRYGPPSPGALLLPEQIFLTPHYHEEEFSKKLKLLKQRFHEFHQQQKQGLIGESSSMNETMSALSVNLRSIENDLKEVRDYLRHMKKKIESTDQSTKNANDWKQVALVLDRTFFIIYFSWFVISLFVMLPKTGAFSSNPSILDPISLINATLATDNLTLS